MGQKVAAKPQAREEMAKAIRDAKRRFNLQRSSLDYEVEARFALQAITNSTALLKCAPETATEALVDVAATGLSLNPSSQLAILQSRWNSRLRRTEVTFMPQYRGLVKLATDTGVVKNVRADVVFEIEERFFDVDLGDKPYLKHKPQLFADRKERVVNLLSMEENKMIGAYCIAYLKDAEYPHITVMDLGEILTIARSSDAFNPRTGSDRKPGGPWVTWGGEMAKKAVIKRASKQWPASDGDAYARLQHAIAVDNRSEINEQHSALEEDEIRGDLGEKMNDQQVERIRDLCQQQDLQTSVVSERYNTNGLGKIPAKYFDEIEERLLQRLRELNERRKKDEDTGGDRDGDSKEAAKEGKKLAKGRRGKAAGKGDKE